MSTVDIPLKDIRLMEHQPRSEYDEGYIKELVETFKKKGFKGAITVWKPPEKDFYEIISGHCRFLALEKIGVEHVACAIYEGIDEAEAYELAIMFNEQRRDLTLLELSNSYQKLIDEYGKTPKDIAKSFQTSQSTVHNVLSVLKQPDYIKEQAHKGTLTLFDVITLKTIDDEEDRVRYAKKVVRGDIAKTRLNDEIKTLVRRKKVVDAIPNLEMEDLEKEPSEEKEKHESLFIPDDFKLYFTFGASVRVDWGVLPQRNILMSAYYVLHARGKLPMIEDIIEKRKKMDSLMIDSSAIIAMNKGDTSWFKKQKEIVALANAVEADAVVMLDVLCKPKLLEKCNMTVAEAQAITIDNAEKFLSLETPARKVFVLQGYEKKEYLVCINAFEKMGIFDDNSNIIGIGSSAGEKSATTFDRYKFCCDAIHKINPKLEVHGFGIGSPELLVKLYEIGVTSIDNQTPAELTKVNLWINPDDGESYKGLKLADSRIPALYQAQQLWNYAAYWCGVNNLFRKAKEK